MQISSIKVIRNKQTCLSEGYGFVEFYSHATAEKVLQNYAGILMPNTEQPFRLNWATFSTGDKRSDNVPDLSIFVGDLAADVTDSMLHETFASKYPSVKAAKVVFDATTGRSKGYGFVRFGDDNERSQAMTEMNGVYCSSRPMRIGAATPRKSSGYQQQGTKSLHLLQTPENLSYRIPIYTAVCFNHLFSISMGCGVMYFNSFCLSFLVFLNPFRFSLVMQYLSNLTCSVFHFLLSCLSQLGIEFAISFVYRRPFQWLIRPV